MLKKNVEPGNVCRVCGKTIFLRTHGILWCGYCGTRLNPLPETRDVNANDLRELRSAPLTVEEKLELGRQRMQEQIDGMTPGEFKSFRKMND